METFEENILIPTVLRRLNRPMSRLSQFCTQRSTRTVQFAIVRRCNKRCPTRWRLQLPYTDRMISNFEHCRLVHMDLWSIVPKVAIQRVTYSGDPFYICHSVKTIGVVVTCLNTSGMYEI